MIRITRGTAVAMVLTLLAAGAAPAWPAVSVHPLHAVASESLLSAAWSWLGSLALRRAAPPAMPAAGRGVPAKAGCGMDPDGRAIPCPPK